MKHFSPKTLAVLVILAVSGIIACQLYFRDFAQKDTVNIHLFPKEIDGWTSEEITITEKEYKILETKNAFVRKYTSPEGEKVYIYIVYSQTNRKVAHPPELCFAGSGLTLIEHIVRDYPVLADGGLFKLNRLHYEKKKVNQIVYYWFKVGDAWTSNYWGQQALVAVKSLLQHNASSAMIRLSTTFLAEEEIPQGDEVLQKFARKVLPFIPQYLP